MANHVCDVLDVIKEIYKYGYWDTHHKKNLKVYEVVTSCPICDDVFVWLEYRYYKNCVEFEVCESELVCKGE